MNRISLIMTVTAMCLISGCASGAGPLASQKPVELKPSAEIEGADREDRIPPTQLKSTPATDPLPPILHSDEYEEPVPMPYPINTAGAEDSGFIMPDGNTFYFWFTPDPNVPPERQLSDGVTGIYMAKKAGGEWQKPKRVLLQDPDKQALDGCASIQDSTIWFCSARTGYAGIGWFTASWRDGIWTNWRPANFDPEYEVGELHITADGQELYFHSARPGGKGQYDIWVSKMEDGQWGPPLNVQAVNSSETDGWPSLMQDGRELWFTRTYLGTPAIFKSERIDGKWQEPELVISQFAGESSIDDAGNIYFTHHFFRDGVMLEADIYVAYVKRSQ